MVADAMAPWVSSSSGRSMSIQWLLMSWLFAWPGHQGGLCQYYGCWCPGSLHGLVIREDCQYNGCWCPGSLHGLVIREDYVNTMVADALAPCVSHLVIREDYVNTMVADALAPCIARSSATIVLTMYGKRVFHGKGFWLPAPFQCGKNHRKYSLCSYIYIYINVPL